MAGSSNNSSIQRGLYYARLQPDPIIFEPLNTLNNIFFDPANRQVFCLRSGGQLGVTVKGPDTNSLINFRMNDRGNVLSIKFSPDNKILGIQRSETSIEFLNFSQYFDIEEFSQPCKSKNARLIGFVWTSATEILYITNTGLELYQVISDKKSLRLLKTVPIVINWFCWQPEAEVLAISNGNLSNTLNIFQIKPQGVIIKLPKFEVDPPQPSSKGNPAEPLKQKDCLLVTLYGCVYACILKRNRWGSGKSGTEIVMYKILRENPAKKCHILVIDVDGRIAVSIVDHLIVVHHQTSKTSFLYDIGLPGEYDGFVSYHFPVVSPLPIQPCSLSAKSLPAFSDSGDNIDILLYSPAWIVFTPDMIIDGELGCMWYLHIDNTPIVEMMTEKSRLIQYLLNRTGNAKDLIMQVCYQIISSGNRTQLFELSKIFDQFCEVYKSSQNEDASSEMNSNVLQTKTKFKLPVVVCQEDLYESVFKNIIESHSNNDLKFIISVLTEYMRSCNEFHIPLQPAIYTSLITILVESKAHFQLHQFIQYHAVTDSKQIACLLLSLEASYPPAFQLALDMLKRLKTANEEIVEVLLSKQFIFEALKLLRSTGQIDSVSARKYLEAAKLTNNHQIFYSVFKFFEKRNARLRANPRFAPGEHCDSYVKHFTQLFGSEALEPTF